MGCLCCGKTRKNKNQTNDNTERDNLLQHAVPSPPSISPPSSPISSHSSSSSYRAGKLDSKFSFSLQKCNNVHDLQNAITKKLKIKQHHTTTTDRARGSGTGSGSSGIKLMVGIDYSEANKGDNGVSLHYVDVLDLMKNVYQEVLEVVGQTLSVFDPSDPNLIHVFGFGDMSTKDKSVFPYFLSRSLTPRPCKGTEQMLNRYVETTRNVIPSHPTSFAPLIRQAIEILKESPRFHLLLILTPGQIDNLSDTRNAIVEASHYSLAIVIVGIGEGPWSTMESLCHFRKEERKFENTEFVVYDDYLRCYDDNGDTNVPRNVGIACAVLQHLPRLYRDSKKVVVLGS